MNVCIAVITIQFSAHTGKEERLLYFSDKLDLENQIDEITEDIDRQYSHSELYYGTTHETREPTKEELLEEINFQNRTISDAHEFLRCVSEKFKELDNSSSSC